MSKSVLNRVLIISFVLIWSIVGFQIISHLFGKNEVNSVPAPIITISQDFKPEKKQLFDLPIISRDPFLGKFITQKKDLSVKISSPIALRSRDQIWPSIEYYGFVKGENSNSPLILLKINNSLERFRKESKPHGLLIKQVFKDSIVIQFKNEKKIFYRN